MTVLKILTNSPLDSFRIDLMFGGVWSGAMTYSSPSTLLFWTPERNNLVINGTEFQYDYQQESPWLEGTITSIVLWNSDYTRKIAEIGGLNIELSEFGPKLDEPLYSEGGLFNFLFGGNDSLVGSAYDDSLYGHRGDDTILAGAGDDYIAAGDGNDVIDGGTGYDIVSYADFGSLGPKPGVIVDLRDEEFQDPWGKRDRLISIEGVEGSSYADTITGNAGDNTLYGLDGNDKLIGLDGDVFFVGGEGEDTFEGGDGFDMLSYVSYAGNGRLLINFSTGTAIDTWGHKDIFDGIEGARGTGNADDFIGSDNDDFFQGMGGSDRIDGGLGNDTVSYAADRDWGGLLAVNVDLQAGTAIDGFGETDLLTDIESVDGTDFADVITGSGAGNWLYGGLGNDTLSGLRGSDTLVGGGGNDAINGGDQNDSLYGGDGNDVLYGNLGNDYLDAGTGSNTVYGNEGNDQIVGGSGRSTLYGNAGNDEIFGGSGSEAIYGDDSRSSGNDWLYGGLGNDTLTGGKGRDGFVFHTKLNAKTNVDRITDFNAASDTIYLDYKIFPKAGFFILLPSDFVTGTKARDASDRIIYNTKTGELFYDPDGTGRAAQVKFAVLANKAKLTADDFLIYI